MGKNIYEILNDVKINEDEYEKINLTDLDKAQKQKRILKKIKKNNKSHKNIRRAALATAAALIQQYNRKSYRKPSGNKR